MLRHDSTDSSDFSVDSGPTVDGITRTMESGVYKLVGVSDWDFESFLCGVKPK